MFPFVLTPDNPHEEKKAEAEADEYKIPISHLWILLNYEALIRYTITIQQMKAIHAGGNLR